jgi:hypothetical protein
MRPTPCAPARPASELSGHAPADHRRGHGLIGNHSAPSEGHSSSRGCGSRVARTTIRVVRAQTEAQTHRPAGLDEGARRGLVVRSERELAGLTGSRHWHLRIPGRPGTLELNAWQDRVWVKVHPLRDGGWAKPFARELAAERSRLTGRSKSITLRLR